MRSEQLQRQVDELIVAGWRIEEETPERVVLVKREYGDLALHLIIFLLTFWTGGIVNVIYGAYRYVNSPKRVLRAEGRSCSECGSNVPSGANYCPECGTEAPADRPTAGADGELLTCPECGSAVAEGSKYCSSCGVELATVRAD